MNLVVVDPEVFRTTNNYRIHNYPTHHYEVVLDAYHEKSCALYQRVFIYCSKALPRSL